MGAQGKLPLLPPPVGGTVCRNGQHPAYRIPCLLEWGLLTNRYKYLHLFLPILQAQLESKEEQLGSENRLLTEEIMKLSGFSADLNTLANTLQTKIRMLEGEKETLQNEVQVAKTEVRMYSLTLFIYLACIMLDT